MTPIAISLSLTSQTWSQKSHIPDMVRKVGFTKKVYALFDFKLHNLNREWFNGFERNLSLVMFCVCLVMYKVSVISCPGSNDHKSEVTAPLLTITQYKTPICTGNISIGPASLHLFLSSYK